MVSLIRFVFHCTDGTPEAGGPGTVFINGFKNGVPNRMLVVDNIGSNARVKKILLINNNNNNKNNIKFRVIL